jgi:hypothetical protein
VSATTTATRSGTATTGVALYDAHDQAVADRINGYIKRVNADQKFRRSTIAERLEWCWSRR